MTPARPLRGPRELSGWLCVAALVAWVSYTRLRLIASGPDLDTDAARHAVIGRRMLTEWQDLRIHWVWLPLWHVFNALVARLGGGLESVRFFNVGVSAIAPFLVAVLLLGANRHRAVQSPAWLCSAESVIPFAAAALFAVWPSGIVTGESGEPEALFQCVVLLTCLLWERGAYVGAGVALAVGSLTRYEAWVLPPVFLGLWTLGPRNARAATVWLIPSVVIVGWCALHAWATHEPFEFLRVNREYVRGAWQELHLLERHPPAVLHPWTWYAYGLPSRSLGDAVWLGIPGVAWLVVRGPRSLVAVGSTLLGFITMVWVRRMNLGLPRHFAVVAPCYAAAVSAAVCVGAGWLASLVTQRRRYVRWVAVIAMAWLEVKVIHWHSLPMVRMLAERQGLAYRSERNAAVVLRANLTGSARAFCDQTEVEVFTGLPASRFVRWNATGIAPYNFFIEAVQHGHALVVSVPERVQGLRAGSQTLFEDGHLVVLRRDAPADIDPALRALILTRPVAH